MGVGQSKASATSCGAEQQYRSSGGGVPPINRRGRGVGRRLRRLAGYEEYLEWLRNAGCQRVLGGQNAGWEREGRREWRRVMCAAIDEGSASVLLSIGGTTPPGRARSAATHRSDMRPTTG